MTTREKMDICKHTKWLCENTRRLEKYAGRWVAFTTDGDDVRSADSFTKVMRYCGTKRNRSVPFVFHVPEKSAARTALPIVKKK
jgi:hypothetical protein